jgi:uncharacterized membrane protein YebE (DUF533 family)
VAKGEKPKIPEVIVKGYGPAALLAAIGYLLASREKDKARAAGIQAGAYAAAGALAISAFNEAQAAKDPAAATGRLLQYNPQAAGRFMAAGAHGRQSPNIQNQPARRIRVAG